ncbi:hypothetical protein Agabi119p4_10288 [Agaricus bisporus var. burnettii]|uniref:BTB domain-containing protein n=1 Tax=Agaricus bisporus var. burnettii TaxID=192524 RepID=A0A8H7C3B1_AGABI|nr:hypothetical protein Agabi119p4_10288 [Agaricus bisporus var. burnettii]
MKVSNAVSVSASHEDSCFAYGIDPFAETYLNPQDVLVLYPSPPAEPARESFPTMPPAVSQSDTSGSENTISISTSFNPTSYPARPDLIFSTSDMVIFYAHSQVLRCFPSEAFGKVLWGQNEDHTSMTGSDVIHQISDSSAVFNVILHALYGTSPARNSPSFEILAAAVCRMQFYGINPKDVITTLTPLYHLLLSYAPLFPLDLYSLAGHYGLESLAVATSSHLLSYPILSVSDEMAERMGPIYLKRLFCLHFSRINALKQTLLTAPYPHPPTKECTFTQQKALTRAWALASAYLAWDARPDLSTSSMRKTFKPLSEDLACELCRSTLEKRTNDTINQWAAVKVS